MEITERNRVVLRRIAEAKTSPYLPTLGDVARALRLTKAGVHRHVVTLRKAGLLLEGHGHPGLVITQEGYKEARK